MGKVTVKFEGVAGSGKTKLAQHIAAVLHAAGIQVSIEAEKYNPDGSYDEIIVDTSMLIRGSNFVGKESRPRMAPEIIEHSFRPNPVVGVKSAVASAYADIEAEEVKRFDRYFAENEGRDEDGEDLQSLMDRDRE